MDQRESRHMRLYLLGAFLAAVLLVYLWVLYDLQVNHYQEYADRSIRSIVRPEQVEASRGILTDRNGRVLVSNRSTYNLTFDASLLKPNQDENRAILQLVELCRQQNVAWNDSLPITSHPPYTYTVDELSDLHRGRFFSYLKNLEPARQALIRYLLQNPNLVDSPEDASAAPVSPAAKGAMALQEFAALQEQAVTAYLDQHPELADVRFSAPLTGARLRRGEALLDGLTAAQVTAQFLHNAGLTPVRVLQWMREDFALPEDFSQLDARLVSGIRYEISLRAMEITTVTYVLAEDINTEFISIINDAGCAGAKVTSAYAREYETDYAAHILGMVGPIYAEDDMEALRAKHYRPDDTIGRSGAEAAFEDYLRGIDGKRMVSTNNEGKITGEYYSDDPKPGNTVELTIDLDFQQAVEDILANTVQQMNQERDLNKNNENETRGAGLAVVKVGTGEVLALASYPTYRLSAYREESDQYNHDPARPLFNRATSGRYAPGSTFKPLVAVAALEEGVTTLTERIIDPGYWDYPEIVAGTQRWRWHCWYRSGHGRINIVQAITGSCNTFFHEMGYRLGIEKLDEYALAFGLGKPTGLEIGDNAGLLASPQEREERGGVWYGGDTIQAAIGQSDNLFTPIQLANYVATLVSGGKHYDAHLLKAVKTYNNAEVVALGNTAPSNVVSISDSTLEAVKEGMHDLTTSSLAGAFQNCVVDAGAKTGTVQLGTGITNDGTFVCFAPYDDPEIALALVIERGNSGSALAAAAVEVLNAYFTAGEDAAVTGENQLLP
ncbi:MAG: penicillin-binding protein A [Oscillibacter sp.]|jgi:penicillin-binding protein 2|nr:penicillin-binding protein A [Oscillibacter sp.]